MHRSLTQTGLPKSMLMRIPPRNPSCRMPRWSGKPRRRRVIGLVANQRQCVLRQHERMDVRPRGTTAPSQRPSVSPRSWQHHLSPVSMLAKQDCSQMPEVAHRLLQLRERLLQRLAQRFMLLLPVQPMHDVRQALTLAEAGPAVASQQTRCCDCPCWPPSSPAAASDTSSFGTSSSACGSRCDAQHGSHQ